MLMTGTPEEEADELKALGNEQYKKGNFEKAIDFYSQAIGLVPGQKEYFGNRVLTLLKVERYDEALSDCDSIQLLDSDWPKGMHLRGLVLEKLNRLRESVKEFERFLTNVPTDKKAESVKSRLKTLYTALDLDPEKELAKFAPKKPTVIDFPLRKKKTSEKNKKTKKKEAQPDSNQEKKKQSDRLASFKKLNTKLLKDLKESRAETEAWKLKYETLEKEERPSRPAKNQEKDAEQTEELKKLRKKLKEVEGQLRANEDENTQLRQTLNKLSGKKMNKWTSDDLFKMVDQHTSQLQFLHGEIRRRFCKKGFTGGGKKDSQANAV